MLETNQIYYMDAIEGIKQLDDKSINLIFVDPPYGIGKAEWDVFLDYINWCRQWILECERVLKDNGSMYICHNDYRKIRDLDLFIENNTRFDFRQLIIWNKRYKSGKDYGYLSGYVEVENKRNYEKMCEYILFYAFNNCKKLLERRKELKINQKVIAEEVKSETGGLTGWVSNVELGLSYPNEEHIKALEKHLKMDVKSLITVFNNQKTHHSVWDYEIDKNVDHLTPKPVDLIKNILLHSSNKNDLVLNLFCGSGNVEIACIENDRNFISFENNEEYFNMANKRINMINRNRFY